MASKQTRRSISVRGTTYALLRDFCAEHDRSMSDVVEELLGKILEAGEAKPTSKAKTVAPLVARAPQRAPEPRAVEDRPVADRAAVRVSPLPRAPEPPPAPVRPALARPTTPAGPQRPVPVQSAGRPAPTPAAKVKGTTRNDYRAIRF